MRVLVVGSSAVNLGRAPADIDIVSSYDDAVAYMKQHFFKINSLYPISADRLVCRGSSIAGAPTIMEAEIAWPGSTGAMLLDILDVRGEQMATYNTVYALKMSHRYLKNSPHFLKTMADIHYLRGRGCAIPYSLRDWYKQREKETYDYSHPVLNQSKASFFDGTVPYIYDHDSIHRAVAIAGDPAYTKYGIKGEEVLSSREAFFDAPELVRLQGVVEEAYVLALERSIIPHPGVLTHEAAFLLALEKVCTSITSGWFREFAWENYYTAAKMYDSSFVEKFKQALAAGKVTPFLS